MLLLHHEVFRSLKLHFCLLVRCAAVGVAAGNAGLGTDRIVDILRKERRELLIVCDRQIREKNSVCDALCHCLPRNGMCLAERQSLAHEIVREIRGIRVIRFDGMTHDVLTQFHAPYQLCIYRKAEFHRVDGVKQPLLILL